MVIMSQNESQTGNSPSHSLLPTWSSSQPGILQPLKLPEKESQVLASLEESVSCLLCERVFPCPEERQSLLQHLLEEHKFVIADVNMIGDFPGYIRYWRTKFSQKPVTEFCSTMRAEVKDNAGSGRMETFFLLSDIIQEDKELRKKLQQDRLEQVLAVQEAERNSTDFTRDCLFCRLNFTHHSQLFDHMAFDHNFSVGQPDNLVFVGKLLDQLQAKLDSLVCLFCEKTFKSREVLKEHMRKKGHKKINPHNREFDQFYLINYLEFGKNWEDISRERGDEELPSGFDSDREEESDWSDWKGDTGGAVCLFCSARYDEKRDLLFHMLEVHGFDFQKLKSDQKLNFYQQVKLINYIRRCVHLKTCIGCGEIFPSEEEMLKHLSWSDHYTPNEADWNQPQFYFPTYENDNLLCALEEDEDEVDGEDNELESRGDACTVSQKRLDKGEVERGAVAAAVPVLPEDITGLENSILLEERVRSSLLPGKRPGGRPGK